MRSVSSCIQPGMSIFCGQTAAHAPQPRQLCGFRLFGRASTAMIAFVDGTTRSSFKTRSICGMSISCGQPSQQ